ncbi:MAG: serine protease [Verrucomicrobiales bacterium]
MHPFLGALFLAVVVTGTAPLWALEPDVDDAEEIFRVRPEELLEARAEEPALERVVPVAGEPEAVVSSGAEGLPADYLQNVLVVKTQVGAGTGFLCTHKGRMFVATNQHVIAGAKSLEIEGPTGEKLKPQRFIAARNVDIVLIGLPPGAEMRRPLVFAENVEGVVTKGDAILVPGNSKGDGVITVTPGTVTGVGPNKLEVDCPVSPGNSGGPIFHVKTRKVIGLLTEAQVVSLEGSVDPASFKDGTSQIKSEVRTFAHRFDTAEKWYALNYNDFRRHSALIQRVDSEMDAVEAFFYPAAETDWKNFRELHSAVATAGQIITTEKLSTADRTRAWSSLTRTLRSLSSRGVRELEEQLPALTYTQVRELEILSQRSTYLLELCDVLARDMQATTALVSRGGKVGGKGASEEGRDPRKSTALAP